MGTAPGTIICMGTQNLRSLFLDGHRNQHRIMIGTRIPLNPQNSVQVLETQVSAVDEMAVNVEERVGNWEYE